MAKKTNECVYDVIFNERDAEILRLELMKSDLEADMEKAISEFVNISKKRKFKKKNQKLCALLLDGVDPDKV